MRGLVMLGARAGVAARIHLAAVIEREATAPETLATLSSVWTIGVAENLREETP